MLAAVPVSLAAFMIHEKTLAMLFLALAMFLLFLSTGPVNTLIIETVPANLPRERHVALSIFMIHLFGDMWSSEIVGRLSDAWDLRRAVLILPVALVVAAVLWLMLAVKPAGMAKKGR